MSLLGNLITQVARQALDPEDSKRNPVNQRIEPRATGGLGDILGSVLGGANNTTQSQQNTQSGGFDMDDVLGSIINSQLGGKASSTGGLGDILGSVLGNTNTARSGGGGKAMLVASLLPIVLNWIQRNGGLSGALSKIQQMGFADQAQSWLSTDTENQNLDPNQINKLFDDKEIEHVCQHTGADETEVRQGLAELLPEIVNQLTPTGGLDQEQQANSEISDILSQISAVLPK
ncbi:YidB family protein [Psychrobacter lutiphocae]|uniref:YidB family protein n=1 Tax=Psychrobacter lutiphocae TaxID=540500 RepID=UPI00036450CD|nr:YidB family protein [Psychrobacter lutiphocae]